MSLSSSASKWNQTKNPSAPHRILTYHHIICLCHFIFREELGFELLASQLKYLEILSRHGSLSEIYTCAFAWGERERERVAATCKVALEVKQGRAQYKANYLDTERY
ncbi:hypothetical protein NC651_036761 [Populus alba x Populus x berolinensis]|nr:hypothetical protein NC651_036761 [Populus alba x Populus x berolinensis]